MRVWIGDLETTGLPHRHKNTCLWEIAGVFVDTEKNYKTVKGSEFEIQVNLPADAYLEPRALEMARARGISLHSMYHGLTPPQIAAERFWNYLNKYLGRLPNDKTGILLGGHNFAGFDLPILKAFMWRWGFDLEQISGYHPVDTAQIAMDRFVDCPIPIMPKPSQDHLCDYLGIEYDKAQRHSALYDAKIAAEIYRRLKTGAVK